MRLFHSDEPEDARIPATFLQPGAPRFWLAVLCVGIGAGVSAIILTRLLEIVQHLVWAGSGTHILKAAEGAGTWRHIIVLLGAGAVVGLGQLVLVRLSSGNGIDITSAIWFSAGRLPVVRTLGSAALSVVVVGMGASLGREGAPKQAGAVVADLISDKARLSDEQRRLLVACGAGAGMAAAYGVPLGGALLRSKCCAECWLCDLCCLLCWPRWSRRPYLGLFCLMGPPTKFRPLQIPRARWPGRS